ncbi:hypothetical protein [Fibrobacter sp. HC4]|uniref:hypothetical protein n=1 Tax=Fibrobacter sp. HC4 TaxID=3239812 RepID=UPI00201A0D1E|nr:hypothetical protein [Fibrobacter succinogenes]
MSNYAYYSFWFVKFGRAKPVFEKSKKVRLKFTQKKTDVKRKPCKNVVENAKTALKMLLTKGKSQGMESYTIFAQSYDDQFTAL